MVRGDRILLGVFGRPHGVRGRVRITSYTDPPEAIASYGPLSDDQGRRFALHWNADGTATPSEIVGGTAVAVADRTAAGRLTNTRLYIERSRLPDPEPDEFYLADLVGLTARDDAGAVLGQVTAVHDYGAGASLEIGREAAPPLLVAFTRRSVPEIDIGARRLVVSLPEIIEARAETDVAA